MTAKLKKYIEYKAQSLERRFPQLQKEDLINDAWSIYLDMQTDNDVGMCFIWIRRYFNKIKMATIRETKRTISLDSLHNNEESILDSPEDAIIAKIDLEKEAREICIPTSAWKYRQAKKISKEYFNNVNYL